YNLVFFFLQAEHGIRDFHVTGVQTCALPICSWARRQAHEAAIHRIDVELAAGAEPTTFDTAFATDGADEALSMILHRRTADWSADRKSTRLNSSHVQTSYAVFCLKKKKLVFT